jgi:SAM-dependent methyltransferase
MTSGDAPYYRDDLALVHHLGFGFHADLVAPGILKLLEPVRERNGLLVELGCGSGLLTRYLLDAGLRVIATDASPSMLALATQTAPKAEGFAVLALPDDPIPRCDAIVAVGHPLSYLPDAESIDRAFIAMANALNPGGVLAVDICDLEWGAARRDAGTTGRVGDDWAIITEFSVPSPDRFVRQMATFLRNEDGTWRRDDERHDNVLIDTTRVPGLLAQHDVDATVASSFGDETLPVGLFAVIGHKRGDRDVAPRVVGLDHVQLAMPPGGEEQADAFYRDVLGFVTVPKPEPLASRGGRWYASGTVQVHLGVETDFRPARKAHPALRMTDLDRLVTLLEERGISWRWDDELPEVRRIYVDDPFGNRIEIIESR